MAAGGEVMVEPGVVFATPGGDELVCDVYRRPDLDASAPAVVLVPGAPDARNAGRMSEYARQYATRGYVAVCATWRFDMRNPGEPGWPHPVLDMQAAVRWAREAGDAFGIDASRVALQSYSVGGTFALVAAGQMADDVAAVIAVCSNSDHSRRDVEPPFRAMMRDDLGTERLAEASPITYADRLPPVLLMNGTADRGVNVEQGQWLFDAVRAAGTPAELHLFAEQGHVFDQQPAYFEQCSALGALFLDRYVAGTSD